MLAMYPRLLATPGNTFFLFGPRCTGKTTWLWLCLRGALWFDLLDPGPDLNVLRSSGSFRARVLAQERTTWMVIDDCRGWPLCSTRSIG